MEESLLYGNCVYLNKVDYDESVKEEAIELLKTEMRKGIDGEIIEDSWEVIIKDWYEPEDIMELNPLKVIAVKVRAKSKEDNHENNDEYMGCGWVTGDERED